MWRPVPGRIKDFIAIPKPNMYQSLHTSVMSDVGQPFEVQIRTHEMHRIAEEGVCRALAIQGTRSGARRRARSGGVVAPHPRVATRDQGSREFLEMVKVDLYPDEVYAFTPKGKVMSFRAAPRRGLRVRHSHRGRASADRLEGQWTARCLAHAGWSTGTSSRS
jgi:GTP pyrophosphokinase